MILIYMRTKPGVERSHHFTCSSLSVITQAAQLNPGNAPGDQLPPLAAQPTRANRHHATAIGPTLPQTNMLCPASTTRHTQQLYSL